MVLPGCRREMSVLCVYSYSHDKLLSLSVFAFSEMKLVMAAVTAALKDVSLTFFIQLNLPNSLKTEHVLYMSYL